MSENSKALKHQGKLLIFNPTSEYYFTKGVKAYKRHDYRNAKKYLERALQLDPTDQTILCQLAIVCADLGEYQQSNQFLLRILEEDDANMTECHYFIANNYAHLGHFKESYHHANLYLKLDPEGDFIEETEDLLDLLSLEGEGLDEEALYEQDDLITMQEEARVKLEAGQFQEAIHVLNTVITDYPEFWSAYNNLALAHFYLGEEDQADQVLNEVLLKNPGNLHAMCNKLVFSYYQKKKEHVAFFQDALKKVQPILFDHQYKLGATFALTGEYELAYSWLRRLQKKGYYGDGTFYYWLSYAAFHTGREEVAKASWKKMLELNPDKKGQEPWNDQRMYEKNLENYLLLIFEKLESEYMEERMFALFLTSQSDKKEEILLSSQMELGANFTALEEQYLALIEKKEIQTSYIHMAHETALILYKYYSPIRLDTAALYLLWFTVWTQLERTGFTTKNTSALAGAVEYTWLKMKDEKSTQQAVADRYGVSLSTLRKYVKMFDNLLQ